MIIQASDLKAKLGAVTLLDLRPAEDFAVGHLPGARHLDLYGVSLSDSSEAPLTAFFNIFKTLFGARGVTLEKPVVVYDHETGERAARALWLLVALGHPDARLLDGGSGAWVKAGNALEKTTSAPEPVDPARAPPTSPPFRGTVNPEFIATRFDVANGIKDPGVVVVDVRRESEYRGTEKRARRAGTIPGAVHIFWREHIGADGRLKPAAEIRKLYESKGVTPDKTVIPVCHGGYRSANTFLALKLLGYPKVRNYVSSWAEWGNRDDTEVVTPSS